MTNFADSSRVNEARKRHSNIVTRTLVFRVKSRDILSQFKLKRKFFNLSNCQSKLSNIKSCIVRDEEICLKSSKLKKKSFSVLNLSNGNSNIATQYSNPTVNQGVSVGCPNQIISKSWAKIVSLSWPSENCANHCKQIVSASIWRHQSCQENRLKSAISTSKLHQQNLCQVASAKLQIKSLCLGYQQMKSLC